MKKAKFDFLVGMSTNVEVGFKSSITDALIESFGTAKCEVESISYCKAQDYIIRKGGKYLTDDVLKKVPLYERNSGGGRIDDPEGLRVIVPDGQKKNHVNGSATNVARVLKNFGKKPLLISPIGKDENGDFIRQHLDCWQIRYMDLHKDEAAITLNLWGESSLLLMYKPKYTIEDVEDKVSGIKERCGGKLPDISIVTGVRPPDVGILSAIADKGVRIYLCPSMKLIRQLEDKDTQDFFRKCEFIQMNVTELAEALSHISSPWSSHSEQHIAKAMGILRSEIGWQNIIITDGAKGVYTLCAETDVCFHFAYPLPGKFMDDTGAGDAFAASFRWQYHKGKELSDAVRFGCVVAAYSITGAGSVERLPTLDEADDWVERWKVPVRKV